MFNCFSSLTECYPFILAHVILKASQTDRGLQHVVKAAQSDVQLIQKIQGSASTSYGWFALSSPLLKFCEKQRMLKFAEASLPFSCSCVFQAGFVRITYNYLITCPRQLNCCLHMSRQELLEVQFTVGYTLAGDDLGLLGDACHKPTFPIAGPSVSLLRC